MGSLDYWINRNSVNNRSDKINRIIMDFNIIRYPGDIIRREGEPPVKDNIPHSDSFNRLYDQLEIVYDFYKKVYGRNSLDNNGCSIIAIGNMKSDFGAAWHPFTKTIQIRFEPLVTSGCTTINATFELDVIGHEITHGVQDYSESFFSDRVGIDRLFPNSTLVGIREHLANVFGILARMWHTGDYFWGLQKGVCREDLITPIEAYDGGESINAGAMTMDEFVKDTDKDSSGSYTSVVMAGYFNSLILSRAFYIFATFVGIGSEPWEIPGKVWYKILSSANTDDDFPYSKSFSHFANASLHYCNQLYPEHLDKLKYAWHKVKVLKPFEEDQCQLHILELQYKAAHEQYWLDLNINQFRNRDYFLAQGGN